MNPFERIKVVLNHVADPLLLIMAHANAPRPSLPYAAVRMQALPGGAAADIMPVDDNGYQRVKFETMVQTDVNVYGPGANLKVLEMSMALLSEGAVRLMVENGVAIRSFGATADLTMEVGDSAQKEERAVMVLDWGVACALDVHVGVIDRVAVEGKVSMIRLDPSVVRPGSAPGPDGTWLSGLGFIPRIDNLEG